ncbi:MAG: 4a-hydroxytetrahydrobiopterin dehydratase [Leptolyngbya sp. SIO4C1]|nr:4a-hydroxytetrahydrobiopterin dehydratase [Leptolyngbya sp. SIO4C1]
MTTLSQQKCTPCSGEASPATSEEIEQMKQQVPDWNLIKEEGESRLRRAYEFKDFQSALAFTQAVGDAAEAEGHHPTLLTEWGKVTVTWWTHAISGLHQNDFIMAAKTDEIADDIT